MADGVAEVQQLAKAHFLLVGLHQVLLDGQGPEDHLLLQGRLPGDAVGHQQAVKGSVADAARLHHLRHAILQDAVRQGFQIGGVDPDRQGVVKGAHQVLALGQVHRHLAADAAVHLGQQGRGYLDEGNAPQIGGRRKAGEVSDDAAPEGQDQVPSGQAGADPLPVELQQALV